MRFKEKNLISFEDQWSILESFHLLLAIWMALGIGQSLSFPLFPLKDITPGLFKLNHFPFHKFEAVPTCCPEEVSFPPAIYWSSRTSACFLHNCIRRIQLVAFQGHFRRAYFCVWTFEKSQISLWAFKISISASGRSILCWKGPQLNQ